MYAPKHLRRWTWPDSYIGASWDGYYSAGVGQSRDSDALERSNFAAVRATLDALPEWQVPDHDPEADSRFIVRESHWAVGWVEWIAVHETDEAALRACDALAERLEGYPVLDEEDFSRRERDEAAETWQWMGTRDRIRMCAQHGVSIFAARRDEIPEDGTLLQDLITP